MRGISGKSPEVRFASAIHAGTSVLQRGDQDRKQKVGRRGEDGCSRGKTTNRSFAPAVPLKQNKDPKVLVFTSIFWGG